MQFVHHRNHWIPQYGFIEQQFERFCKRHKTAIKKFDANHLQRCDRFIEQVNPQNLDILTVYTDDHRHLLPLYYRYQTKLNTGVDADKLKNLLDEIFKWVYIEDCLEGIFWQQDWTYFAFSHETDWINFKLRFG